PALAGPDRLKAELQTRYPVGSWPQLTSKLRRCLFTEVTLCVVLIVGGCSRESSGEGGPSSAEAVANRDETRRKAEQGDALAQNLLGELCLKGQGVPQDFKTAAEWFRKSADQSHPPAEFNLGTLYEAGQGVPFDYARAAEWYRKSAEHGYAAAQYSLAVMYVYARGVERNDTEALKWLGLAARQGEPMAAYAMGERCRSGTGVPQDLPEAYKWFDIAAKQNVADAANALKEIQAKMSREQIAEGRNRAKAFVPQKGTPVEGR
ncbi:MAG TPA: tetratricopeptide repeat protein, partial [Verrucomicrobiae bacterium]|nr:tetratricopeptide repeat protein [Verrucomicrobiae bacterium]